MERAPVTAATGTLGPVVAKLGALLGSEYKLRRRTRKDVRFIKSKLNSVHSILWTIWEEEIPDAESKNLKKKVLNLAADMDDAIDDFVLTMESSHRSKRLIQRKIEANPFQDFKTRVNDVSDRCRSKWKWEMNKCAEPFSSLFSRKKAKSSSPSKLPPPRAPFVLKDAWEIIGMDIWRDDIIGYLVGEEPQLKMASIVGMAGVGKTTLASLVYRDEEIGNKFQSQAFVSVTPTPNMKEVLTSILQRVVAQPLADTEARTEEQIIQAISNFLEDKRYLVIIDDIWHRGEWEIIRRSFPENNLGSRIVITTRIASVPGDDLDNSKLNIRMNPRWSYEKERWLYEHDRRWLYRPDEEDVVARMKPDMVGEGFDCDHPIVRMCCGVPLALHCMFSAVAMVREQQQLQGVHVKACDAQDMIEKQVKERGFQNTPGFEPLAESLRLGYDDLPHHMLMTCLLYCSIYPENHRFQMKDLVMRWVAEGFIYKEDTGQGYFEELCNRGFMLHLEDSFGIAYYQMNPMMRNFLRWKSREDNFITWRSDITSSYASRIHRLCIDDYPVDDGAAEGVDPLCGLDWSQIRSLVVFEGAKRDVPFEKLERVRMLDLQFKKVTENHYVKDICGLLRVRHLFGLEGEGISEIPPEIARLRYLETLQVRGTNIRELPCEIGDLQQLKTLELSYNNRLTELPRETGKLQNLKRLLLSGTKVAKIPREIRGLNKLEILQLDGNIGTLPWEAGQLSKLEGVPEFARQAWKNSDLVSKLAGEILSTQMVSWASGTGGLIVGTKHMQIPPWIKDHFNDLALLDIRICKLEEQDLKILREMSSLRYLALRFEVVPKEPIAISGEGFTRLWKLVVDSRVPRVTFQEGAMPMLGALYLEFQYYGGPLNKDPLGINHLCRLWWVEFRCDEEWYRADVSPCISDMIDVVRKEAQEHPNRIHFLVPGREEEIFSENESVVTSGEIEEEEIFSKNESDIASGEIEEEIFSENESNVASGEIEEEKIFSENKSDVTFGEIKEEIFSENKSDVASSEIEEEEIREA